MTDLVPLILCALDDAVRAKSLAAPEDADLAALADGLTLAVDHCAIVIDSSPAIPFSVADMATILASPEGEFSEGEWTWTTRSRVARRLADVAASLCVRGMALRREAEALWKAASRLLGMEGAPAVDANAERGWRIEYELAEAYKRDLRTSQGELIAWRTWAANSVTALCITDPDDVMRTTIDDLLRTQRRDAGMSAADRQAAATDRRERQAWRDWADRTFDLVGDDDTIRSDIERKFATLKRKHAEDDRALVEAHARELREAKEAHAKEVADLRASVPYGGRLADSMAETSEWRNTHANLERAVCQVLTAAGLEHMLVPGNRRPRLPECDEWKFALLAVIGKSIVVAGRTGGVEPHFSYRDAILSDCAYECTIYHGPAQGEMRVVVGGLRDGKTLDDVAAVLERMGRAPGTYSLREVKTP